MSQPKKYIRRFYTPYEVAAHCSADDCWVSFLGRVFDITPVIKKHQGVLTAPLLANAGKDISDWFDSRTGDIKRHICPISNMDRPYTPMGRFVHIPPLEPMGNWDTSFGLPWWRDNSFFLGCLSQKTRIIRIKNVLTEQEDIIEVPAEETLAEIRERYLALNWHAYSYTWRAIVQKPEGDKDFEDLDMNKTLEQNGVPNESDMFEDLNMAVEDYIPVLHVYWNDDLTLA
uniref:Cytochrome b5 domain-containing protein 1 n=1 Tax=Polytomella parva TaxID=51329 RepID=A0A7S0YLX7_9CHLO|mmetsp:Transcript_32769/g.59380  ORF Transcript_32769/g.59380 Transcript_32769/m.59380 type:complete len:229 (+) Transcript_32769:115-801(+)